MKIQEFPIKYHQCHCEELAAGDEAISASTITEIASLRRGDFARNDKLVVLALGAESAGNFSVFSNPPSPLSKGGKKKLPPYKGGLGGVCFSEDFGDLLDDINFKKFQKVVLNFLKKNKIKPNIILTDLHPLYKTTLWGAELAKKFKAKYIQIQHHHAHIFSAIGEKQLIENCKLIIDNCFGIALDGTGYGTDDKIWGGEIFQLSINNYQLTINRIGHLENQIMIGGDLAVWEPARMLIAILAKIQNKSKLQITRPTRFAARSGRANYKLQKNFIYSFVKKYYTKNQFELLYNQLQNNFNCQETSSTGRILDAVSVLLGFAKNERNYKHEPIELLEKNSTKPYSDLHPKLQITNYKLQTNSKSQIQNSKHYELLTTPLFEYLIKNLHKDKHHLAATAQLYIAQGLYKIISNFQFPISNKKSKLQIIRLTRFATRSGRANYKLPIFLSGGIANNKIISSYLKSKGFVVNKKVPRGDAGISFGQIIKYLWDCRRMLF